MPECSGRVSVAGGGQQPVLPQGRCSSHSFLVSVKNLSAQEKKESFDLNNVSEDCTWLLKACLVVESMVSSTSRLSSTVDSRYLEVEGTL